MRFHYLSLFLFVFILELSTNVYGFSSPKKSVKPLVPAEALLSISHYHSTCPDAEGIISQKVAAWVNKDPTLAPSIIRLHFHDCAVRVRGPFWEVPFGRKDGKISLTKEANLVPQGHENITGLLAFFQEKGLDMLDLVTLSGSHTIGRSTCYSIMNRIYNFNGTGKPDPSLSVYYLKLLRKRCKKDLDLVHLDVITPRTFDTTFYKNLLRKVGLLSTDQLLFSDKRTGPFVEAFATQPFLFHSQFSVSMVKLGNVQVLTRPNEGEIRVNCNYVNRV
ncbi:hypothetical protein RYX36_028124 [Vicia faba]